MSDMNDAIYKLSEDGKTLIGVKPGFLTTVDVPDGVEKIGDGAFANLEYLEAVFMPGSVHIIGNNAFSGCKNLMYVSFSDETWEIGACAFSGCTSLRSIYLPDCLAEIGSEAFEGSGLVEVTIPSCVRIIGDNVFRTCTSLREVLFEGRPEKMGAGLFAQCDGLVKATVPSGYKEGTFAFRSLYELSILTDSQMTAENEFSNLQNLVHVDLPGTLKRIGASTFCGCSHLKDIEFPSSIEQIDEDAFNSCCEILTLKFKEGLLKIGQNAFVGCSSLMSVCIPEGVKHIGEYAFGHCGSLASVQLPQSPMTIEQDAFSCYHESSPTGQVVINGWLVSLHGSGLKSTVVISDEVTRIPRLSYGHGVKRLIIPASVEFIDDRAFANFSDLEEVVFLGRPPLLGQLRGPIASSSNCSGYFISFSQAWMNVIKDGQWRGLFFRSAHKFAIICDGDFNFMMDWYEVTATAARTINNHIHTWKDYKPNKNKIDAFLDFSRMNSKRMEQLCGKCEYAKHLWQRKTQIEHSRANEWKTGVEIVEVYRRGRFGEM